MNCSQMLSSFLGSFVCVKSYLFVFSNFILISSPLELADRFTKVCLTVVKFFSLLQMIRGFWNSFRYGGRIISAVIVLLFGY